jgi:hypothetical protein
MSELEQVPTTEAVEPELVETPKGETVAETGEAPQVEEAKPQEEGKPKRSAGIEKRMSELTAKRREAEARAEAAEQRLAELTAAPADSTDVEPTLDAFDSYDQYVKAQARWEARQEFKAQQRSNAEAGRNAAQGQREEVLKAGFAAQVEDARTKYTDFDAVAFNPNVPVTAAMQAAILESDMSADVAYHLGKNPDVAFRLATMSPIAVAREIGRIEQTILSTPAVVKATQAPDPISPVGQRSANVQKDPDKMSDAEYFAWRKSQKSAR